MTVFRERVYETVRSLGPGEVATFGEVAAESGYPGAARAVGNVLQASDGLPWWRVVTATGRCAPGLEAEQARRLAEEGIAVVDGHVRDRGGRRRGRAPGREGAAGAD